MSTPASPRAIARLADGTDVGAWMLKADIADWDLDDLIGLGQEIDAWTFEDRNERVSLMKAGDPCVLWVYGNLHGEKVAGLWAIGELGSAPWTAADLAAADANDANAPSLAAIAADASEVEDDDDDWDEDDEDEVYVDIDLQFLSEPIPRATLQADKRFGKAVILHRPDTVDPVPLTPVEYAFIEEFLDANGLWPDDPESDAVLDDAEDAAIEHLESLGFTVDQRDEPPYLVAIKEGVEVEVLIAPTTSPNDFVLGAAEFDDLQAEADPLLLVVVVFGTDDAADDATGDGATGDGAAGGAPRVAHVVENWRPDPARYDRSTQLHLAP